MKPTDIYKALGGFIGISVIGVGTYFTLRALWPYVNSEDGDEPAGPMPLPPGQLPELEVNVKDDVVNGTGLVSGQKFVEGWKYGQARTITVMQVEPGFWLDLTAADHYIAMRDDAKAQGVILKLNTAYRTMAEQQRLYALYKAGKGAKAALPGWSNHQMGLALDIESANGSNAAFHWLTANAAKYKFKRTVASEPWHWEFVA